MDNLYDYQKFAVLYVDDEEMSLKYFKRAFQGQFQILTAANAKEAYELLERHGDEIALIMTDQRMPGEQGVQLLGRARQLHPHAIRILTTAYSDVEVAIDAVNSGAIYKYVTKPWEVPDLEITLKRALEFFTVQRERDFLMREKLSSLHKMMIMDRVLSLGIVASRLGRSLRNSLAAMRAFLDLVPDRFLDAQFNGLELRNPNFWKEFYDRAQQQVRRIAGLLTDLVDGSSAAETAAFGPADAVGVLEQALEKLKPSLAQHGIAVVNAMSKDLPPVAADAAALRRAFDLLLQDEIVNLENGKQLTFEARRVAEPAEGVEIEIRDDGPGLPREALRAVFDPFLAAAEDGPEFGVNLVACYFILYHFGGTVSVQSGETGGLTFKLTLPLRPGAGGGAGEEEAFINRVLVNDAFWERVIGGPE